MASGLRAQSLGPVYAQPFISIYPPSPDVLDTLTLRVDTNSANGVTWFLPTKLGTAGQFLTTKGVSPDTLYWSAGATGTVDTIKVNSTLTATPSPITSVGTLGVNLANHNIWLAAVGITDPTDEVPFIIKNGAGGNVSDLTAWEDNTGTPVLSIGDEGEIKASGSYGTAGYYLTSGGSEAAMTWTAPITPTTVTYADTVLNSTLTFPKSLTDGTFNDYNVIGNNFDRSGGADAATIFTGIVPNRINGFLLAFRPTYNNNRPIIFKNENSGSRQADRIITPNGDLTIDTGETALLIYDTNYDAGESPDTLGRWIVAGVYGGYISRSVLYSPSIASPTQIIKPTSDIVPLAVDNGNATYTSDLQDWRANGTNIADVQYTGQIDATYLSVHSPSGDVVTIQSPTGSSGVTLTLPSSTGTAALTSVAGSGTGTTSFTAYMPVLGGTTSTGALQSVSTTSATPGSALMAMNGTTGKPLWEQTMMVFHGSPYVMNAGTGAGSEQDIITIPASATNHFVPYAVSVTTTTVSGVPTAGTIEIGTAAGGFADLCTAQTPSNIGNTKKRFTILDPGNVWGTGGAVTIGVEAVSGTAPGLITVMIDLLGFYDPF